MIDKELTKLRIYEEEPSTHTINLNDLFGGEVTSSGSFDLKGVQASSLGKLLHSLRSYHLPSVISQGLSPTCVNRVFVQVLNMVVLLC